MRKKPSLLFLFFILLVHSSLSHAEQNEEEKRLESTSLKNITQLTFSSMGFEKAGEAYFSPDGQKIAFQAVPKGKKHYQIFVMDLKEGLPRMVSTGRGACTCAYFRPDGKKMIFASSHEDPALNENSSEKFQNKTATGNYKWDFTPYMNIYEANLDGSELKALTTGPAYHAECAYSYDGSEVVYASNEDGYMNLYVMKADGSAPQQVTYTTDRYNGGPFFAPDNQRIIFRADYEKPDYLQIYVIHKDGSDLKQVTDNKAVNWAPFWHPRGDLVAFTTSLHGHHQYEIYLIDLKNGFQSRITYNPTFDGLPVFDLTGTKMMWTSKRSDDGSCQVFIADFELPSEFSA